MGSSNVVFGEHPSRVVTISRPFYLGKLPVTQAQWLSVTGENPSAFPLSPDHPVENVSWLEAVRFCQIASARAGRTVRLPSEAEWEYACRAGSETEFFFCADGPFSDDASVPRRVRESLGEYAWFDENSRGSTHPAGRKQPNSFGLHDVLGNVWEWCADNWHPDYIGAPSDGRPWIEPPTAKPLRCLRGGAWDMNAFRCRSCYRSWDWESLATNRFGLRVCVEEHDSNSEFLV
jgi:formylglycine-generating enzyme required for sulfatase activity